MAKSEEYADAKLKVLALHGYRQNADSFKAKLGSFRKFVSKYAEFVFVPAPHAAAGDEPDPSQRSWWFNTENRSFKGSNVGGPAYGFEESLKMVEKVWEKEGCHGILGFSQGACFAGLLCDLSARGMTTLKPQFAVLASGFRSGSLVHVNYYQNKLQIPSLHIFGETDEIITKDMSEALSETFLEPEIVSHSGGHYFPALTSMKQMYVDFFRHQLQHYLEAGELQYRSENSFYVENPAATEINQNTDGSDSD